MVATPRSESRVTTASTLLCSGDTEIPSCPCSFLPQHATWPATVTAHTCPSPAAIALNLSPPSIATGRGAHSIGTASPQRSIEFLPISPEAFEPQQYGLPSTVRAQVKSKPAVIETNGASSATRTGCMCSEAEIPALPSPTWPSAFIPQQWPLPSMAMTHACRRPAVTATAGRSSRIRRGVLAIAGYPGTVGAFPQQKTEPVSERPHAYSSPTTIWDSGSLDSGARMRPQQIGVRWRSSPHVPT